ncbi:hypothetical protein RB614_15650 [Phytohabitans sp. ZYX-F-186]|uniref:Condensation domain-containing protein n=1 Tax=Phytohabitans maris TaxID=3071409 RepID=A0ABU0ZJ16_9ACTN|nr:hypothetical protein [Phytohabitans sp. ZYX-F-186]MDQ7905947.1 hypothetical protein [Phytohabitans sp. ZYX-F-186]
MTDELSVAFTAEPCPVPFQGCSQRSGGIGWAQEEAWSWISRGVTEGRNPNYDLCFSVSVPAGTTVTDFLTAIARMVRRHEALRTRFECVDGRLVRQWTVGSGNVDVTRYRARAGHMPTDELLRDRVGGEMLDVEHGSPFRAGFVATAGVVTHAAFAVSRIIADAGGGDNVILSFAAELAAVASGVAAQPVSVFQQLDQVDWEASADGLRAEREALDYWREQLNVIRALPRPAVVDGGTMRSVLWSAESVVTAADEIARRSATSSSGVVLTAFLLATTKTLGLDAIGCYLHCSNRADLERRASISRLKSMVIYAYSPGGADVQSAMRAGFRGSLTAYRHAQSPGLQFLARLGMSPDEAPFIQFNDKRSVVPVTGPADPALSAGIEATAADPDKPVIIENQPFESHADEPMLKFSVELLAGSRASAFVIETNILDRDGIFLLMGRMQDVLAAANTAPAAEAERP